MAEAEDVLLDAAVCVAAGVRAAWSRRGDPRDAAERAAAAGRRRLERWLAAGCGRGFALVEVDPPPGLGAWAGLRAGVAPWQRRRRPLAIAARDGDCLLLPRGALASLGAGPDASVLLPALGLGLRAEVGAGAAHALPLERDVAWVLEGALVDAALARALPGLAGELEAARRGALRTRPASAALRPAERAVEELVRGLLRLPVCEGPARVGHLVGGAPTPRRLGAHARRLAAALGAREAGAYRGLAPVPHWGEVAAARLRHLPVYAAAVGTEREGRIPGRRLARRIVRRPADPADDGSGAGPFLLPPGDPHLSLQDARGLDRPLDRGEEDLDALAEELARLPELPTVAAEHPAREVLEDGASAAREGPGPAEIDPDAAVLAYPEWDYRREAYRLRGCRLRERSVAAGDSAWVSATKRERAVLLGRVRRHFESLRPRRRREPRRVDGDGIDIDAFVEELAERRAGHEPSGRLYTRDRRARRDVAVALLLDASGSTDAWVSQRQRVIDVAKEAALCFCEALAALGDRLAVYACSGQGAGDVRVQVPKRFADCFGDDVLARIGALEPDRYTRLGGPLRHATAALSRTGARVQLLLLLSDGKPNDEDAYAGEYGIEDVRQAVLEARALGVRPFCITIDREGPGYLPRLFGPSGYTLLWDVEQLPLCLPRLYGRLADAAR